MYKIYKIIIILIIINFPSTSHSHVKHYDNLNRIEFDIYRNNKQIGRHTFSFERSETKLAVHSDIYFEIKKLGVVLYKYKAEGTEIFSDGKLIEFYSKTKQNKKDKYVNMKLEGNEYIIDGSSYKGKTSKKIFLERGGITQLFKLRHKLVLSPEE